MAVVKFKSDLEIDASKELTEDEKKRAKAKLRGIKASNARQTKLGNTDKVKTVELVADSMAKMHEMLQPKPEIDTNTANGFNSALISSANKCLKVGATKEEILQYFNDLYTKKVTDKLKNTKLY